jgi:hypothetical protein
MWLMAVALVVVFAFRLAVGLSNEFFFEDETQIFLMGLRYYATGAWPYFGADVVWTKSEIPGALQPLLVGVPLDVIAAPESPYVVLNLLSMGGLAAFAWYVTLRLPSIPRWLVWGWLMAVPWTLLFSTHIINPSYVLAPALVFFIGFFEAVPIFRRGAIPVPLAFVLMGAAISWILQIHMSWPLLLPYAGVALVSRYRDRALTVAVYATGLGVGLIIFGWLVIPTAIKYGMSAGAGGTARNLRPHWVSPWIAVTSLARFFSFASLEVARFIAPDGGKRLMLLARHFWLAPIAIVAWVFGVWQPLWMLREYCRPASPHPEWRALRWLVAGTVVLVYASYWFVLEPAQAHAFYVVSPLAFMFAAYCWTFVDSPRWRRVAAAALGVSVAFHAGLAWVQAPEKSLYRNRRVIAEAIRLKQPEMFGHRRAFAVDGGPPVLDDPTRPYETLRDVQFTEVTRTVGPQRVALWTFTVRNTNPRVAFRDVQYQTHYRDAAGRIVEQRYDYLKDVFQPGEVAEVEVNDGIVSTPFSTATIEMVGAEALLPIPPR